MSFGSLKSDEGLSALEHHLATRSYVAGGAAATCEDFEILMEVPNINMGGPHLKRWAAHIGNLLLKFPYRQWPRAAAEATSKAAVGEAAEDVVSTPPGLQYDEDEAFLVPSKCAEDPCSSEESSEDCVLASVMRLKCAEDPCDSAGTCEDFALCFSEESSEDFAEITSKLALDEAAEDVLSTAPRLQYDEDRGQHMADQAYPFVWNEDNDSFFYYGLFGHVMEVCAFG